MSQEKPIAGSNSTRSLFLLILILFGLQSADTFAGDGAWSFAFMADTQSDFHDNHSGVNSRVASLIAQEMACDIADPASNCELVLIGGDLIRGQYTEGISYTNQEAYNEWKQAMKPVYDAFIKKKGRRNSVYPVRGNHDAYHKKTGTSAESVRADWLKAF